MNRRMRALVVGDMLLTTSELGMFLTDEFGAEVEVFRDFGSRRTPVSVLLSVKQSTGQGTSGKHAG